MAHWTQTYSWKEGGQGRDLPSLVVLPNGPSELFGTSSVGGPKARLLVRGDELGDHREVVSSGAA